MMSKILLIDDNPDRMRIVRESLVDTGLRNAGDPIFNSEKFEIYPKEDSIEDFCKNVRELDSTLLYFMIYEFIEENSIDALFTDLTFNDIDKIGSSSGEKLIKKLLENNLHKDLPIIAYSRKSENQVDLDKDIRAKITYVFVGTEINDAAEIRRKFKQKDINEALIQDKIDFYKENKCLFDLAVICALNKEYRAIKNLINNEGWSKIDRKYDKAYWKNKQTEVILKVALTSMNDNMGMVEATLRTLDLINFSKPKLVAMTGIAGGSKKNGAKLGDVCVAKTIDNWQSGKYKTGGRFDLSPEIKEISIKIKDLIEDCYMKNEKINLVLDKIIKDYGKEKIDELIAEEISSDNNYLKTHIKDRQEKVDFKNLIREKTRLPEFKFVDMMTGSSLVTDEKVIDNSMIQRNRKAFFFDMEGYAVARVSHTKEFDWIVIKAIVDYGNHLKGDDWHEFASLSSAKILYQLSFDILGKSL